MLSFFFFFLPSFKHMRFPDLESWMNILTLVSLNRNHCPQNSTKAQLVAIDKIIAIRIYSNLLEQLQIWKLLKYLFSISFFWKAYGFLLRKMISKVKQKSKYPLGLEWEDRTLKAVKQIWTTKVIIVPISGEKIFQK